MTKPLDFFLTRRSTPAKALALPIPSREELSAILTVAARVPDHGKLEPWRFIVIEKPALARLAALAGARAAALNKDETATGKAIGQFERSHLAIAVVEVPRESPKIPAREQTYSAGAAAMQLVNAAQSAGWGANWLTGWIAFDRPFLEEGLGLAPNERLVGTVHLGSITAATPERPRPDMTKIITWMDQ